MWRGGELGEEGGDRMSPEGSGVEGVDEKVNWAFARRGGEMGGEGGNRLAVLGGYLNG